MQFDQIPGPEARATFAPEFGRRFALFADAEEEFDWRQPFNRNATATTAIASLPEANRCFTDRHLIPTYLIDYPVATNPESAATIAEMVATGACDIGTQLHPWVNPPFDEDINIPNSFVGNLPRALERAKLHALTERIETLIGRRPTVYRAGRYGVGPNSAGLLREAGYRLDVSIRSLFDYSDIKGPNFSYHPIWPWWVAEGLLEVPLTATFIGGARRQSGLYQLPKLRGVLSRTRLLNRVALTPEGAPLGEALIAIRYLLDEGVRLFSLSFHTPSVVAGHTPYVRDAADLKQFWTWWDGVFNLFAREGVLPACANEIIAAAR